MNGINLNELMKGTCAVLIGLAIVLVPFSLLIGWNMMTMFLFWLFIVPALAIYLPTKASKSKSHLLESIGGLIAFYGFMVFMIYDHYQSDYFQVMVWSFVMNLLLVSVLAWTSQTGAHAQ